MVGSFKLTRIQAIQHISTFFRLGKCNPCNYLVTWKLGVWNFVMFRLVRRWLHFCFSFAGFGSANMKPAPPVGFNLTFVCPQGQVFESDWLAMPFVMMTCQVLELKITENTFSISDKMNAGLRFCSLIFCVNLMFFERKRAKVWFALFKVWITLVTLFVRGNRYIE